MFVVDRPFSALLTSLLRFCERPFLLYLFELGVLTLHAIALCVDLLRVLCTHNMCAIIGTRVHFPFESCDAEKIFFNCNFVFFNSKIDFFCCVSACATQTKKLQVILFFFYYFLLQKLTLILEQTSSAKRGLYKKLIVGFAFSGNLHRHDLVFVKEIGPGNCPRAIPK